MRVCVHIFVCVSSVVSPPLYGSNRESVNVSLGIDKKSVLSCMVQIIQCINVCASSVVSPRLYKEERTMCYQVCYQSVLY